MYTLFRIKYHRFGRKWKHCVLKILRDSIFFQNNIITIEININHSRLNESK